jgi:hypothetical protein
VKLFARVRACSRRIIAQRVRLGFAAIIWAVFPTFVIAGQSVSLGWIPSPSPYAAGYAVYYGIASGSYNFRFDAGTNITATITNLAEGFTYYFVVATYDGNDFESIPSNEVSCSVAYTPPAFKSIELHNGQVVMTWDGVFGRRYQIQFKTSLNQSVWRPLRGVVRTLSGAGIYADSPGSDCQRFYRLMIVPESFVEEAAFEYAPEW